MSILRLIVAWLVMAALPMQGIAAASMLFCDQATHSTAAEKALGGHDHAAHGHGDHDAASSHGDHHASADQGSNIEVAQAGHDGGKTSPVADDHACPICASCCNLVALSETPTLGLDSARPAPPPLQGPSRVSTREAPTPDKPPRA